MLNDMTRHFALRGAVHSDVGQRPTNEDSFVVDCELGLFAVADGLGGQEKGEIASCFAADEMSRVVSSLRGDLREETFDPLDVEELSAEALLEYGIFSVNAALFAENERALADFRQQQKSGDEQFFQLLSRKVKMGTTFVSMLFRRNKAYIASVGDSRAYRIMEGSVQRLTHDHSRASDLFRAGDIEASKAQKRNVLTRSLGGKSSLAIDVDILTVHPRDRFLLCSDGLSNMVSEDDIRQCAEKELQGACQELVGMAKMRGGKDNITAVLVDVLPRRGASEKEGLRENAAEETVV